MRRFVLTLIIAALLLPCQAFGQDAELKKIENLIDIAKTRANLLVIRISMNEMHLYAILKVGQVIVTFIGC